MIQICVIFLAEVSVVTLGTLRIIFVSRGNKVLAPLLGFFEVSLWLFAMAQTMGNLKGTPSDWSLTEWGCFLGFALGFTLGNFLGIIIEQKLALGSLKLHVITQRDAAELVHALHAANFGATIMQGEGTHGPVDNIIAVIRRRDLPRVLAIIESFDPGAFYASHELQNTSASIFPLMHSKAPAEVDYTWQVVSQVAVGSEE